MNLHFGPGYTTPMHPLSAQGRNQEPHIEETDEET